jgi:thiamine biosynthesis lipoprotein
MVTATLERERARPLLGTLVRIRVTGHADADRAINRAFAEIDAIHGLMSFQQPESDLGRIARTIVGRPVAVDPRTAECLSAALAWARRSDGAFDPVAAVTPDATWEDIALEEAEVRVTRPLRVNLSGIAKGYAVDRACAQLQAAGVTRAVVDAGGDLRVLGPAVEEIALRPSIDAAPALVELCDGALASSDPAFARMQQETCPHLDGRTRVAVPDRFAAVAAPTCMDADALTKIVLSLGADAQALLHDAGATAFVHDGRDWSTIGECP